jgi:FkbM family methyltransferase
MTFRWARQGLKGLFKRLGLTVYRNSHLPLGLSWTSDIKRLYSDFSPAVVFDVGANIGQTALVLRHAFPKAVLYSFEPGALAFQQLQETFGNDANVRCHQTAFYSTETEFTIYLQPDSRHNSVMPGLNTPCSGKLSTTVKATTIDRFCAEHGISGIDILKIDTEGADVEVLKGAQSLLGQSAIKTIYIEAGFDPASVRHVYFYQIYEWLTANRFVLSGLYEYYYEGIPKRLLFCNALFFHQDFC